jgi:hypothetical protein
MPIFVSVLKRVAFSLTSSLLVAGLAGCGLGGNAGVTGRSGVTPIVPIPQSGVMSGTVHGGQQPVTGATLQLYAAGAPAMPATGSGTGGYGAGAIALITVGSMTTGSTNNFYPGGAPNCSIPSNGINSNNCTALPQTDGSGDFTLSQDYTCTAGQLVYIVATGGNPGLSGSVSNPYLALMSALGTCPASGSLATTVPIVNVNEVSTVATVWVLQQFTAAPSGVAASATTTQGGSTPGIAVNIGTPSGPAGGYSGSGVQTSIIGLMNAFGMMNNMVDISIGSAAAPPNAWATPETTRINSLANILAYCINSSGASTPATAPCPVVMADATPSGSTAAADTIQAAWYIAQNPGLNVSKLFALGGSTPPFPGLASAPNDFTLAVNFAPTFTPSSTQEFGVAAPHHVAIDLYGNAWLSNNSFTTGLSITNPGANVAELAPNGSLLMKPVLSFTASTSGGSYSQFTTKPSSAVSFSEPRMVAIDTSNNVWVANYNSSLGTPAAGSIGYFTGSTASGTAGSVNGGYFVGKQPWGIAIDGHNNVYVTNTGTAGSTAMDGQSIGKIVASTGAYSYSTSSSNGNGTTTTTQLPNVTEDTNLGNGLSSAVLAIDANTAASGGADGILWTVSPACFMTGGAYDSTATIPWGVLSIFDADTLSPLSGSQATTSFSNATAGTGSTTNCGTSTYTGAGLVINQLFTAAMALPYGVAIDRNNGVWIAADNNNSTNTGFNGLTYLQAPTSSTGVISGSAYEAVGYTTTAGTVSAGNTLATNSTAGNSSIVRTATYNEVDGNNNVWVAGQGVPYVGEASYNATTNAISFIYSSQGAGWNHTLANAYGLAIDASGNVWIANSNTSGTSTYAANPNGPLANIPIGSSMTVMVGAAGPLVTPLSLAVESNMLGRKP